MEELVVVMLAIAAITAAYSFWKQFNFSLIVCGALFVCFALEVILMETWDEVGFLPHDLTDTSRSYTIISSMYAHGDVWHLLFNVLGIAFIGSLMEQRMGTRPYILLYFVTGICGTLAYAAIFWNSPSALPVVGASGAISGVLGGLARLYPNERFSMIVGIFPLPPMPMWIIVGFFTLFQLFIALGDTHIAWQAHLGGLAAGFVIAPFISKLPLHKRVKRMVSLSALRRMATTPELKTIIRRIEDEEVTDVRSAWIEHFLSKARCPHCGASLTVSRSTIRCKKGHLL